MRKYLLLEWFHNLEDEPSNINTPIFGNFKMNRRVKCQALRGSIKY